MRPLRYSINVTLDGCCDHRVIPADEESTRYWAASLERADALLFGRVIYEMPFNSSSGSLAEACS